MPRARRPVIAAPPEMTWSRRVVTNAGGMEGWATLSAPPSPERPLSLSERLMQEQQVGFSAKCKEMRELTRGMRDLGFDISGYEMGGKLGYTSLSPNYRPSEILNETTILAEVKAKDLKVGHFYVLSAKGVTSLPNVYGNNRERPDGMIVYSSSKPDVVSWAKEHTSGGRIIYLLPLDKIVKYGSQYLVRDILYDYAVIPESVKGIEITWN